MAEYKVNQDYRAVYRGQVIAFSKGRTTEVDEDLAEWVNRDSPGTLSGGGLKGAPVEQETDEPVTPTEDSPDEFVCETCGKVTKSAAGLAAHERSHEGD